MTAPASLPVKETVYAPESPFVDLTPWLDGTAKPIVPEVAEIWPGRCLFYCEAVNEIHGEPGIGKSNVLLAAAGRVLSAGGAVVYLDPEDSPARITARALALGLDREAMRERFHYLHDPDPSDYEKAQTWAAACKPSLVVLDGLAEALAREALDENVPGEILGFFRARIRPFSAAGAAVVIADHVVKDAQSRGRYARGSGAKLAHYNGAVYEVRLAEAYTPTKAGSVNLKISKDRNGGAGAMGETVAELHFTPDEGRSGTILDWREPAKEGTRPTKVIGRIMDHLAQVPHANKRGLLSVGKDKGTVERALELLIAEGAVILDRVGQEHQYRLAQQAE
jgi:hypothetical protein